MANKATSILGSGWSFPPSFTKGGADVIMVADDEDIQQSLNIILATEARERFLLDNFGCNLNDFLFEEIDQRLLTRIRSTVKDAITFHEPRIKLEKVIVNVDDALAGLLQIQLTYQVISTNSRFNMVYPFYINEGN